MKIHFERTGGLAGMKLQGDIDADKLSPAEARQLNKMIDAAKLFDLPESVTGKSQGADQFQYKLVVESQGRTKTIRTNDAAASEALAQLLDWLTDKARKQANS